MSDLRTAAQQALEALDAYSWEQVDAARTALKAALAEPVQEPVAKVELMTTGGNAGLATRIVEIDDHLRERLRPGQLLYAAPPQRTAEPVQEPYCYVYEYDGVFGLHREFYPLPYNGMKPSRTVPLYTAPRVPLAEWQINDLMADIDPEDRDSWSFRQGVYAAEKYHGVRK